MHLNYPALPVLGTFFVLGKDLFGKIIQYFTGGDCTHAGLITDDHGQKFATEETGHGLDEDSLERYTKPGQQIVAVYYWQGWDDPVRREAALSYLAEIRRKRAEESQYDWRGILGFVFPWIKPDPKKQWCSENVLSIHDKFGFDSGWGNKRPPSPEQLKELMKARSDVASGYRWYV